MIGVFSYTVILTYLGLTCGITGLYFCLSGNPIGAVICLLLAGLFDLFDGAVARTKKNRTEVEKNYGIQIDSLSDLICFGVLPPCLGFACGMRQWYFVIPMVLYTLAALIRLAYYNVTEEERQKSTTDKRKYFVGLPVTFSMFIFAILFSFVNVSGKGIGGSDVTVYSIVYAVMLLVVAGLFVSKVRIPKCGKRGMIIMVIAGFAILGFIIVNMNVDIFGSGNLIDFCKYKFGM